MNPPMRLRLLLPGRKSNQIRWPGCSKGLLCPVSEPSRQIISPASGNGSEWPAANVAPQALACPPPCNLSATLRASPLRLRRLAMTTLLVRAKQRHQHRIRRFLFFQQLMHDHVGVADDGIHVTDRRAELADIGTAPRKTDGPSTAAFHGHHFEQRVDQQPFQFALDQAHASSRTDRPSPRPA